MKDLTLNGFANDDSVSKTIKSSWLDHKQELNIIPIIEKSMWGIESLVDAVWMEMNDNKTEFIYFGGPRQLEKCIVNQININGEMIPRSYTTRYLGAYLDSALNFKEHIKIKCKAVMLNLLKIKATRKFLTKEASSKAVIALVTSHLDRSTA